MKLIYLTSQAYPSKKVDPFFWRSMAEAFYRLLGDDFLFVVRRAEPGALSGIPFKQSRLPRRFRLATYFFWLPYFIVSRTREGSETVFFSSDPYLLSMLVFWRAVLGCRYRIASDWHQLFGDWRDGFIARRSDVLVTTSMRLKRLLHERCGAEAGRILTAYGGVDPEPYERTRHIPKMQLRARLDLPQNTFIAGYVGGFKSVGFSKGLDTMIGALRFLPREVAIALVGGSKGEVEKYRQLAQSKGLAKRCLCIERQPFDRAVEYECAMDALVIPYPDEEHFREWGFPLKVWEYLSSARPIVYSNLELIAEALEGRGVPFVPDDARSLSRALEGICRDPERAEAHASRNPDFARTWEARAIDIVRFIEQKQ